jgi:high-affinity Fe2+/Pb2+ permease
MRIRVVLVVGLLSLSLARVSAAQLGVRRAPHIDSVTMAKALARVDSSTKRQLPRAIVGASVGAVLGAALGYELALLGHRMFCEGSAQCATRPDRAIRESALGGVIVGGVLGGVIAWTTGRVQQDRR